MSIQILAQGGSSFEYAENTIDAYKASFKQGASGLAISVHLSQDGHIVVTENADIGRVSSTRGYVYEYTLEELKKHIFTKQHPTQEVSSIPTLEEVYQLVAETKATINIELRDLDNVYPTLPEKLVELENQYNMTGRVLYTSLNHYSLQQIKQAIPDTQISPMYTIGLVEPWEYAKRLNACAIHPHMSIIKSNPNLVEESQQNGIQVYAWTANEPNDMQQLANLGVDAIITGKPKVAFFLLDE